MFRLLRTVELFERPIVRHWFYLHEHLYELLHGNLGQVARLQDPSARMYNTLDARRSRVVHLRPFRPNAFASRYLTTV